MNEPFYQEERQSTAILSAIIEAAIDGIVIIDASGKILTLNPAAGKPRCIETRFLVP